MTYSIGFRQPARGELARELLQRLSDEAQDLLGEVPYRDPRQSAVENPGEIPALMQAFARDALDRALRDPHQLGMLLGELLTEPKPDVWFAPSQDNALPEPTAATLDRRTRMMYDARHIFINGESFRASGRDARLMRRLADARHLSATECKQLSAEAAELLHQWMQDGWAHAA